MYVHIDVYIYTYIRVYRYTSIYTYICMYVSLETVPICRDFPTFGRALLAFYSTLFVFQTRVDSPSQGEATCSARMTCNTYWNVLKHTATHCNTLQHTATHCKAPVLLLHQSKRRCIAWEIVKTRGSQHPCKLCIHGCVNIGHFVHMQFRARLRIHTWLCA